MTVHTSTADGLRTITLSKPPRNLLDGELVAAMLDALETADNDEAISGILLTGSGDVFCGGLDVADIQTAADAIDAAAHLVSLLRVLPTLRTPIAAAVNGDAIAGGASIVCACDYAVAVPELLDRRARGVHRLLADGCAGAAHPSPGAARRDGERRQW